MGVVNTNLPTKTSGSGVSECALEEGVTVGSRLVLLLSAAFVYCTTLETFFRAFQAKNGTKELGLKADYARKMKNLVTILRQGDVGEVLGDRFT